MQTRSAFAPGKIILSGEYAMLFGKPGIAVPSVKEMHVTWKEGHNTEELTIEAGEDIAHPLWNTYINKVVRLCEKKAERRFTGTLEIDNSIPAGKGMGSSTALVIALARCLLGENCEDEALGIEDKVNPGHSGMDFAVVWTNTPIVFARGTGYRVATIDTTWMLKTALIDTGVPDQPTPELVRWIRSREAELREPIEIIGRCTERLLAGEDPAAVIRDHHKAQCALGVVSPEVQKLIADIEKKGGAAKVIGAGGRTGGGGMVMVLN
jgi:mevalonate kinase